MAQSIACPQCRTKLTAPIEVLGQPVRCTRCGSTFTAGVHLSPYLEDMPKPPTNRRPMILGGAILAGLMLVTGLVLYVNSMNDETGRELAGSGKVDAKNVESAFDIIRPKTDPKLVTKDGTPIVVPEDDGPDRIPPPGVEHPLLKPKDAAISPTKKKPRSGDDVWLNGVRWDVAPNVRQLIIGYEFQNGATPSARLYTLKLRIDGGAVAEQPLDETRPNVGTLIISPPAVLGDRPGKLPKIEVWVERAAGAGVSHKASNTVSTE